MKTKDIFKTIFLLGVLTVVFPSVSSATRGKPKADMRKKGIDAKNIIGKNVNSKVRLGELGKILEQKKVSDESFNTLRAGAGKELLEALTTSN